MSDDRSQQAVPDMGAASPRPHDRHLYDWMVDELVTIADEMIGGEVGHGLQRQLVSSVIVSIAEHISTTRGSGSFAALPWLGENEHA